ncbi:hypothetical protein [Mycobacterium lentiflavum]|uniref:hypothetical protein n=1 Tax=Mycobacterium lentiflavum TaxID=141349 RepID=UPI000B81AA7E|nr:hypothetical protein [Mycobacterium lentiflavum]
MTDESELAAPRATTAGQPAVAESRDRPSRLGQAAAWVVIVAGIVFVVAVIFFSGLMLGWSSGHGHGWDRDGWPGGRMHPGMTGCPMMSPGGMMSPAGPGPSQTPGPSIPQRP